MRLETFGWFWVKSIPVIPLLCRIFVPKLQLARSRYINIFHQIPFFYRQIPDYHKKNQFDQSNEYRVEEV